MTESWLRVYIQYDVEEIRCFQTVVLEKTLKESLGQQGDQISQPGSTRTETEAEAPIL